MNQTRMFKAIETKYSGRYFRSRLEARWAVFFDSIGLKWEYEQVGFTVGPYRYLPDFELPEVRTGVHIEIKPFNIPPEELEKVDYIREHQDSSPLNLWIIKGVPAFGQYEILTATEHEPAVFAICRGCGGLSLLSPTWTDNVGFHDCKKDYDREPEQTHPRLDIAYEHAMKYRFDHKEAKP